MILYVPLIPKIETCDLWWRLNTKNYLNYDALLPCSGFFSPNFLFLQVFFLHSIRLEGIVKWKQGMNLNMQQEQKGKLQFC